MPRLSFACGLSVGGLGAADVSESLASIRSASLAISANVFLCAAVSTPNCSSRLYMRSSQSIMDGGGRREREGEKRARYTSAAIRCAPMLATTKSMALLESLYLLGSMNHLPIPPLLRLKGSMLSPILPLPLLKGIHVEVRLDPFVLVLLPRCHF